MPLTDAQKHLLHELYEVPYTSNVVYTSGKGTALGPAAQTTALAMFVENQVRNQLNAAIVEIDADETRVTRVGVILSRYEDLDLDPSNIDKDGYSFRYQKAVRELKRALSTYTGIWVVGGNNGNQTPLG
ncbi:hypothetical protein [Pantanalinema sp. GBBB05]|uniref:hypothetical protein n=1 Tax=Pantanalinema sp. GBBB05 TaxID=2604139 RepID=UPI001D55D313|nr:hypothetical protein [Pantanalinema sp. GBBB05]